MGKFTSQQNRKFWEKDALEKKDNPIGTHSDPFLVELENNFIITSLKSRKIKNLLDIGCGNGQRTIMFSRFVKRHTTGIDYSANMIDQAKMLLSKQPFSIRKKISFEVSDIQKFEGKEKFDAIISCRCFINQTSYENQIKLFKSLNKILSSRGSLIIAEGSHEGYTYLNSLRKQFGLKPIKIPWYNLPIKEKIILPKIKNLFKISNLKRLGAYYYLTRVIHPALVYPKNPNPKSKINELSMKSEYLLSNERLNFDSLDKCGAHLLIHFKKS